jgi:chitinase
VFHGDHAPQLPTLPGGTYPSWSLSTQYKAGDKVLYQGLPYQAKWVNEGVSPATESTDPARSAWQALFSIPGEPGGAAAIGAVAGS